MKLLISLKDGKTLTARTEEKSLYKALEGFWDNADFALVGDALVSKRKVTSIEVLED